MKQSNLIQENSKKPIVRIAPVCNGKIYVVPRMMESEKNTVLELPIVGQVEHVSTPEKTSHKVMEKFHQHVQTEASPRFCVMHQSGPATVYLHVLPLKTADEIHFQGGVWVTSDDINDRPESFSTDLQKEGDLLGMAAELWEDFYRTEGSSR